MGPFEDLEPTFIKEGEPDFILTGELKDGDEIAFRALVAKHKSFAFDIAYRLTKDIETAKKLASEALQSIWDSRELIPDQFTTILSPPFEEYVGMVVETFYKADEL